MRTLNLADWSLSFPDSTSRPPPGNLTDSSRSPPPLAPSVSADLPPVSCGPLRATSCQLPTPHNNELLEKTDSFMSLFLKPRTAFAESRDPSVCVVN